MYQRLPVLRRLGAGEGGLMPVELQKIVSYRDQAPFRPCRPAPSSSEAIGRRLSSSMISAD
jgi:hypothetical protein